MVNEDSIAIVNRNSKRVRLIKELAKQCLCNERDIQFVKKEENGLEIEYYIFVPTNSIVGRNRWDLNGNYVDSVYYKNGVFEAKQYMTKLFRERAKRKSVNRSREEAKERERAYKKGLADFIDLAMYHLPKVVIAASIVFMISCGSKFIDNTLNPQYANDAFNYGKEVVNVETHRTQNNEGFWYDYGDMASRYDESYDFDSFVYGTYSRVGWNQESRIECMNELFRQLNMKGITEFDSFVSYCEDKGVCEEKGGELVVNDRLYQKLIESQMMEYNSQQLEEGPVKSGM